MVEKKSRDYYFDNAKFLLIILVVLAHAIGPIIGRSDFLYFLHKIIFIFHMPAFVFLSGYFMKYTKDHSKSIVKFTLLYLSMQTVYYLVMKYVVMVDSIKLSYSTPYWSYWFLLALVAWHLVFPHVKEIKGMLAISFLVGILIGYDNSFDSFLGLSRIIVFFPFFLLGYYTKKELLMSLRDSWKKYLILAVCMVITYMILKYEFINLRLLFGKSSYDTLGYTAWFEGIYRVVAYCLSVLFGTCFFIFVPTKQVFYSTLGQQTLNVYLMHGLIIKPLERLGFYSYFDTFPSYIGLIVMSIVLTFALSLISQFVVKRMNS